jgi:hypothetical protein
MAILVFVPLVRPIGLPIRVGNDAKKFYNTIESLAPGSAVLLSADIEAGMWGSVGPACVATLQHLFNKPGVIFIQANFYRADGQVMFSTMILPRVNQRDKVYGVDWVDLGYIEGHETAMAALARDFLYPVKDVRGKLLQDYPIMQKLKSAKDISLYIDLGTGDFVEAFRQISIPYKVPSLSAVNSMSVPEVLPYVNAGMVIAVLNDAVGGAEYEFLLKSPGLGMASNDAISATHLFLMGLAIVTNCVYMNARRRSEKTQ